MIDARELETERVYENENASVLHEENQDEDDEMTISDPTRGEVTLMLARRVVAFQTHRAALVS
jgi:hypothetical protein